MPMGVRNLDDEQTRALGFEHALEREREAHEKTRRELRQAEARIDVLGRELARKVRA